MDGFTESTDSLNLKNLNLNRTQAAKKAEKMPFFVPGNLDLQTRPSKGPNTSSV